MKHILDLVAGGVISVLLCSTVEQALGLHSVGVSILLAAGSFGVSWLGVHLLRFLLWPCDCELAENGAPREPHV